MSDNQCANAGSDSSAMQATMQSVAQMLMREVPDLAGVVQHRGDALSLGAFSSCGCLKQPHHLPAGSLLPSVKVPGCHARPRGSH